MSLLSEWIHKVANFVTKAIDNAPADQHEVLSSAGDKLTAAAQAVEATLPVVAKLAVDGMLIELGWGQYIPNANGFIDSLVSELMSRKTGSLAIPKAPAG